MTTTTSVFLPDEQEQQIAKKPPQSVRPNGHTSAASESTAPDDAEIRKLNEEELKAAIVSAWKKLERIGKKEMGGFLYWLREKLRAQGARNDIRDHDKGFGVWVWQTIEISRRTADRWANDYGLKNGLIKRKPTSRQDDQKLLPHEDDNYLETKRRKHKRQIQMNYWVDLGVYQQHEQAVEILKKHFKTTSNQDAIVKGVQYAARTIHRGAGSKVQVVARVERKGRNKQAVDSANRHRTRRSAEVGRSDARPKALHATAG
jgi:hypothetical protein